MVQIHSIAGLPDIPDDAAFKNPIYDTGLFITQAIAYNPQT
jgi:hypothetical protein